MTLRHHLASLGAVLLALAVGLVAGAAAGGSPSAGTGPEPSSGPAASGGSTPGTGSEPAPGGPGGEADRLLAESLPTIAAGSLGGRQVAVLALGARAQPVADTLAADLAAAGAAVPVRATVEESWPDPAGADLRDGLTRQLGAQPVRSGDPLAVLLAGAVTGAGGPGASPGTVWGVLTGAGLLSGDPPGGTAPEVLVVAAPAAVGPDAIAGWTALVEGLAVSAPVLLAAPASGGASGPATAGDGSLVVAVRESPTGGLLSTADHADSGVGRLAVLRATADLPAGDRGHYGSLRGATSGAPGRG